jgi:hypothetical protein
MNYLRLTRTALCVVVLGSVLTIPIASAAASDASIKATIKSYSARITVAEGHLLTAIGKYKASGNPTVVDAALKKSIGVFRALKAKVGVQSASSTRIKTGKRKFESGLQQVIVAYEHLKTAFGEKRASPQAAKAQAKKALLAVKAGRKELMEGAKLLS